MKRVTTPLVWALPAVVTAVLGGWRLTVAALWADELATWGAVRLSWERLWRLAEAVDVVLTPYYAGLKAFAAIAGTSTTALRIPSLLAMILTTLVVVALGRRAGGDAAGLGAGLLFAVLPATSRYAQEARPYALAMLGAALALLALIRLLERPTAGRAALYAAAVAATGLCHPLSGLLMIAGHALAGWRLPRLWLPAAAAGGLPALALCLTAAGQSAQISWIALVGTQTVRNLPPQLFVSAVVGGLILGLAILGPWSQRALAGAGLVPIAILLAAGLFTPVWVARYVLITVPALVVLAAWNLSRARLAAVVALAAFLGYPAQLDIREPAGHGQDSARIAAVIRPLYRPGDVAVFPDSHYSIGWAPRDLYQRYLPAPRPPDVLATTGQRLTGRLQARECPDAACLGAPDRIWVIRVDSPADPLQDMTAAKRDRISDAYRITRRWSYPLLGITLMERR
ncbi:glycosyltransferase family 39 protein [Actinoplanes hulinensis]|uniref:Glycosyltransferase family 39 protein n=1 Tax=Actinoplanes hulinensis TaxID=1144547 RepID=A0ABS7AZA2_9ACTN|nr:glycosyltransferase family 39 protein [Actinoplanes hulinensis]MBW6433879.1 glycosyltransferase family 39 protein [Actinoplanes hulinensis]